MDSGPLRFYVLSVRVAGNDVELGAMFAPDPESAKRRFLAHVALMGKVGGVAFAMILHLVGIDAREWP